MIIPGTHLSSVPLESPHGFTSLSRRDFLSGICKTALALALAGAWRSPATAAPGTGGASYALNPLAPWGGVLKTPAPQAGPMSRWGYRWIFNYVKPGGKGATIRDIGTLQIQRTTTGDRVQYEVEQSRTLGDYQATLVCDAKAGEPVIEWRTRQVTSRSGGEPLVSLVEGTVTGNEVAITRGPIHEKIPLSGPLHSEIAQLVHPANLEALAGQPISLLEGGAMVRPNVLVRRDAVADATVDGVSAAAWLMTGTGLLPAHFMVDAQGRGLCRTLFTTSIVLQEASA
jgi:hypothetical protein